MVMNGFVDGIDSNDFKMKIVSAIRCGESVMTERIDDLCDASGKVLAGLRLMSIFQVKDRKITAWRDYFDTAPFKG
ncbi:hypothetical protein GCM10025791_38850 [Halioxenophilus aromaticivorans]|jgi:limonene-1,2-epoxide hydrolase|tara:strand:+ start:6555 stop:6782 length:228 start_codon:yes stop_codon:yes gene_type:complete